MPNPFSKLAKRGLKAARDVGGKMSPPVIESAEVVDICLDKSHSNYLPDGQIGIGAIKARKLESEFNAPADQLSWYKPMNANVNSYPIIGEFVMLMRCPSPMIGTNKRSFEYLYFNPINLYNSVNSNHNHFATVKALSFGTNFDFVGNIAKSADDPSLGDYFEENSVRTLNIHEGDILLQGRNRQSIRLGHTAAGASSKPFWGKGSDNDPVIVLSCGHEKSSAPMMIDPSYTEDINKDAATIIMSSTQQVDLQIKNKLAKGVEPVGKYKSGQIILNSDQLVLNSKKDLIIMSGQKGISVSTDKWKYDVSEMMTLIKELIASVSQIAGGKFPTGVGPTGPHPTEVGVMSQIKSKWGQLEA